MLLLFFRYFNFLEFLLLFFEIIQYYSKSMKLLKRSRSDYFSTSRLRTVFHSPEFEQNPSHHKKRISQYKPILISQNIKKTIGEAPFTPKSSRGKYLRNHLYYNNLFKQARKIEKPQKQMVFLLSEKPQNRAFKHEKTSMKPLQSVRLRLKKYTQLNQVPYLKTKSEMISSKKENRYNFRELKEHRKGNNEDLKQVYGCKNKGYFQEQQKMKCMPSSLTCLIMNHCQAQLQNLQNLEQSFFKRRGEYLTERKKPSEYSQWINMLCELQQLPSVEYPSFGRRNSKEVESFSQENPYELFSNFKQRRSNKQSSIIKEENI